MHPTQLELPLFPLHAVLFPDGHLPLRIFERRYLDMVRDCARQGGQFGINLILDGEEAGTPATSSAVGTVAHIVDFNQQDDGLLGIVVKGGASYRVLSTRVRDDGLIHATVELLPPEPEVPVPVELALLSTILERVLVQLSPDDASWRKHVHQHASWVGFRLAEIMPLDLSEKQQLLVIDDPIVRLERLRDLIAQSLPE